VVQSFGGRARFVVENYGDSELARRNGVTRYPAIFVGDVLVATPKDFGFYGKGEGENNGRYAPLKSAASHDRFRADLARMVELLLAGRTGEAAASGASTQGGEISALPALQLVDLAGRPVTREALVGKVVAVEFWATWCPPCGPTLAWLGELRKKHGDDLVVLAPAVESDEEGVRKMIAGLSPDIRWAMGTPELARAFGDISAVPTLFLFDRRGKTAQIFYGAPPTLHAEAEKKLAELLASRATASASGN
jgi:cytochrome c biogenesis protein CcmG/thiol:disulfide interchange protein DsbE